MPLLQLIFILFLIGVALWAVNKWGAQIMDAKIVLILNIAVVIAVVIWLLHLFGIFDLNTIRVGK